MSTKTACLVICVLAVLLCTMCELDSTLEELELMDRH